MSQAGTAQGKYMYCIIRSEAPTQFTTLGIGERGDVVHIVEYMNLAAVVSDSPVMHYDGSRRDMMAHTRVLEEVMRDHSILPVRFGTVAPTAEAIRDKVLKRRYGGLIGMFGEVEDRVELGIKAFWYEDAIFQEIVAENEQLRALRDALLGRPLEETYYDRIRLGEMIESVMWQKRASDSEKILARLRPISHDTVVNKVISDRMALNAAFLVYREQQAAFDEAVSALDQELGKRLLFRYVGPVPPYNFVNITVNWGE